MDVLVQEPKEVTVTGVSAREKLNKMHGHTIEFTMIFIVSLPKPITSTL